MSAYMGVVGSFYEVECASSLRTTDAKAQTVLTALGGRRIAQQSPESRRTWDCSVDGAEPAAMSRLSVLRQAVPMPWVFYSSWALVTNILTPDHSAWKGLSLSGATPGSVVELADGGLARSLNDPVGARTMTLQYPVVPGRAVTGGVYARQAGATSVTLRLSWVDAAGSLVSSTTTTRPLSAQGPLQRLTVTAVAPPTAVACYLVATNHSVLAAPSMTVTPAAMPWSVGGGCLTAVVDGVASDAITAWPKVGGQRASYSFTVTEVG